MRADHSHECRNCGGSIDTCTTPNDECNDHPGDCDECVRAEQAGLDRFAEDLWSKLFGS